MQTAWWTTTADGTAARGRWRRWRRSADGGAGRGVRDPGGVMRAKTTHEGAMTCKSGASS